MAIAIAIHGGAGNDSPNLKKHEREIKEGLAQAIQLGYGVLEKGGLALDAVEEAVRLLEDNSLFNAGRGSALNCQGEIEMDASIMDGQRLKSGAVSMVRHVKNPIALARLIMEKTKHAFLSGYGASDFAKQYGLALKPDSYFITEYQYTEYERLNIREAGEDLLTKGKAGTVGAVALDKAGNLAAGTSTGGTSNCLAGRIGDSCVIGAGCYANNKSCAVSGTGEGEYLITGVIAHTIAMMVELNKEKLQAVCDYVLHQRNKGMGHIGVIAISHVGEVGIAYNTQVMKRAWIGADGKLNIKIRK